MTIRNVVLVHGAFADGSSWSKVARRRSKRVARSKPSVRDEKVYLRTLIGAAGAHADQLGKSDNGEAAFEAPFPP